MIKISIVIPIYNCEKYLEQCIQSVLRQNLKEMEVLCIDDGSTDSSPEIVRRFQCQDNRIVLYRQQNQGAGPARNLGIRKAQGKYVAFLDADDYYLDSDALSSMFRICEEMELAVCGSLRKNLKNGIEESEALFQTMPEARIPYNTMLDYMHFQLDYNYQSYLFLREHLTKNEIYFPAYRRFQDPPFFVQALYKAGRFAVAKIYLYCYRLPDMEYRFDRQKTCDLLRGLTDNLLFAWEHNLEKLFKNTVRRLEDEYVDIICKNIFSENVDLLTLLMNANKIISAYYTDESYVIQPLRTLMFCMNQYSYRSHLLQTIERQKEIVLYGAGKYGKLFWGFLKRNHLHKKVSAFVVSDLKGNEIQIEGIPVISLHELLPKKEIPVYVTVRNGVLKDVKNNLIKNNYKNYQIVKEELLHAIAVEENS